MAPHDSPPPPIRHPGAPLTLHAALGRDDLGEAGDVPFTAATEFSGRVMDGALFAGLPGTKAHGATYLRDAIGRGAVVLLSDRPLPECPVPVAVVKDAARAAFGEVCHVLHGRPSEELLVTGVTGTNGKTTVAWLLRSVIHEVMRTEGKPPLAGLCGTIETDDGREIVSSKLTTPACEDLHAWLARCVAHGCEAAAVELSSHALGQDRAAGVRLTHAIVTNVSRDHLDYHGSLDAVRTAKLRIARLLRPGGVLWINGEPAAGLANAGGRRFSVEGDGEVRAVDVRCDAAGTSFTLHLPDRPPHPVRMPLLGRFNVANAVAAACLGPDGVLPEEIAAGLANVAPVPGRLEPIDRGQPFRVLVDYAHTPDGLRAVIDAVRPLCEGRLHLLVGAGGDRDRGKRAEMGAAAGLADRVVFTSDNPRSEDPHAILRDLAAGCPETRSETIENRRAAIAATLAAAAPGDWVLVCGKGHETTQEIAGVFHPFDDRTVCREELAALRFGEREACSR